MYPDDVKWIMGSSKLTKNKLQHTSCFFQLQVLPHTTMHARFPDGVTTTATATPLVAGACTDRCFLRSLSSLRGYGDHAC